MRFWVPVLFVVSVLCGFSGVGSVSSSNTTEPQPLPENGDGALKWKGVTDAVSGEVTTRYYIVDHLNLTGYSQILEELDETGNVVANYHYGLDLIGQSRLEVDETTGSSDWVDRIFVYDGFSGVGPVSVAGSFRKIAEEVATESLALQAGLLRDASGSYVGYYAPLESPLRFPLLASIPLPENKGGSVRALSDLEGYVTDTFSYDSFGNLLFPSSFNLHTSYLYRGERYDPDLGQYYLRARFYDANLGRFHTLDEYEGRTREPLSLHKYLYAHANPVTGWDPSGRMSLVSVGMTGFAISAVAGIGVPNIARIVNGMPPSIGYFYAYMDGLNPFGDPFGEAGKYPLREKDYMYSRIMGHVGFSFLASAVGGAVLQAGPAISLATISRAEQALMAQFVIGNIIKEAAVTTVGPLAATLLGIVSNSANVVSKIQFFTLFGDYLSGD